MNKNYSSKTSLDLCYLSRRSTDLWWVDCCSWRCRSRREAVYCDRVAIFWHYLWKCSGTWLFRTWSFTSTLFSQKIIISYCNAIVTLETSFQNGDTVVNPIYFEFLDPLKTLRKIKNQGKRLEVFLLSQFCLLNLIIHLPWVRVSFSFILIIKISLIK